MNLSDELNGALVTVNPETGRIEDVYLIASDDKSGAVVSGAMARIIDRRHWGWIRNLIKRRKIKFRNHGAA